MTEFIPQMEPLLTGAEHTAVELYMRSGGWLTEFEETRAFEQSICEYTGARCCVMAPSGTLALFLALTGCGVGQGDEVLVPDLTMAASATAVTLAGANVVFAEIEPETLCLDLNLVEEALTPQTKAIIFVSLNGRAPVGLAEFIVRMRARGIRVIEDAAQSLGSTHDGRHLATLGDAGIFSFSSQKIVTTGQGGAVVTDDEEIYQRMLLLRDFGRPQGGSDHYQAIGWNLKFTDLQAVIGLSQMRRLPEIVGKKKHIFECYREALSGMEHVCFPKTDLRNVTPWFVDLFVGQDCKQPLMHFLREHQIGTRELYPALHGEPAFASTTSVAGRFPVAEEVSSRGIWLPSSLKLQERDIERICGIIRQFFST